MFGIVYKITGGNEIYVGSTVLTIEERMKIHRSDYNGWKKNKDTFYSSFLLFDKYGFENCPISIIEEVACDTKSDLVAIEDIYIRKLNCVNRHRAKITKEEQKENVRKWKIKNRERMLKKQREYNKMYSIKKKQLKQKNTIHIDDGASLSTK